MVIVIRFYEFEKAEYFTYIYYADMTQNNDELEFVKSPLEPTIKAVHAIMTGNRAESRKIVVGYAQLLYKEYALKIPKDLLEMIVNFYDEELVHFFAYEYHKDFKYRVIGCNHFVANIRDIIPNF